MIAALLLALATPADAALFDPVTGYRIAAYRGVVPAPPPSIDRLTDAQAEAAQDGGKTLFIDVTPAAGATRDADTGVWHLAEAHETIPGAHWYPEAGRGPPNPPIDSWFAMGLKRLAGGRHRRPIVVFCLADCWMSWNASWKLKRLGYTHVAWYANGIDGWKELGRPLEPATPAP